jgi:hypothetical protein
VPCDLLSISEKSLKSKLGAVAINSKIFKFKKTPKFECGGDLDIISEYKSLYNCYDAVLMSIL